MPSAPDSSGDLPSTPRQPLHPDSVARDTVPTGPLPHSTLPPAEPAFEAPTPDVVPPAPTVAAAPTSEVRALSGDPEHTTLHSASHPGSGASAQWDERRVLHLERELDQLSARHRLLDKRIDDLSLRFRTLLALLFLGVLLVAMWLVARG